MEAILGEEPPPRLPSSLSLNPAAADPAARTREQRRRLTQIVKQYWDFTSRLLRHLGVSEADVEDGAQQVFLTLDQKLGDVLPGRERAFLAACAVHIAARVRRARARKREVGEESMLELVEIGADPERALEQQRRLERLERILGSMGEEHRAVFVLYEIEELTMAEVAEVLGIPPGTVASRLRRARELFREGLSS